MPSMTVRIPDVLKGEIIERSQSMGISFTAFVSVAVRHYLDSWNATLVAPAVIAPDPPAGGVESLGLATPEDSPSCNGGLPPKVAPVEPDFSFEQLQAGLRQVKQKRKPKSSRRRR